VRRAVGAALIVITAAGVVTALTALFMSMRSVMDIGGSCGTAEIGDGISIRPCPGGVAGLLPGAIWGGLIFTGLYVLVAAKWKVPTMVSLIWPALFLSLAYNFFDYGINGGSVNGGWTVCGIVFALMGAVPLVWALPHLWRVYVHGEEDAPKPWHVATTGAAVSSAVDAMKLFSSFGRSANDDMADSLEKLDRLHKSGALDDLEYAKAKDRVIRGGDA
jgi:hypothetical protein